MYVELILVAPRVTTGALDQCGSPSLILFFPPTHTHTHTHTHDLHQRAGHTKTWHWTPNVQHKQSAVPICQSLPLPLLRPSWWCSSRVQLNDTQSSTFVVWEIQRAATPTTLQRNSNRGAGLQPKGGGCSKPQFPVPPPPPRPRPPTLLLHILRSRD